MTFVINWPMLLVCAACFTAGNTLLRLGLTSSRVVLIDGGIVGLPANFIGLVQEWRMYLSVLAYGTAFLIWMRLVATGPISILYPVVSALAFIMVFFADFFIIGTALSLVKLTGIAVIVLGIWIVSAWG